MYILLHFKALEQNLEAKNWKHKGELQERVLYNVGVRTCHDHQNPISSPFPYSYFRDQHNYPCPHHWCAFLCEISKELSHRLSELIRSLNLYRIWVFRMVISVFFYKRYSKWCVKVMWISSTSILTPIWSQFLLTISSVCWAASDLQVVTESKGLEDLEDHCTCPFLS